MFSNPHTLYPFYLFFFFRFAVFHKPTWGWRYFHDFLFSASFYLRRTPCSIPSQVSLAFSSHLPLIVSPFYLSNLPSFNQYIPHFSYIFTLSQTFPSIIVPLIFLFLQPPPCLTSILVSSNSS